jgi:hypothetical protein
MREAIEETIPSGSPKSRRIPSPAPPSHECGVLMSLDLPKLLADRIDEKFDLHERYLNPKLVRMLRTIGFDRDYERAAGQYLYDRQGERYLDLLAGFGVFALGRNHPCATGRVGA